MNLKHATEVINTMTDILKKDNDFAEWTKKHPTRKSFEIPDGWFCVQCSLENWGSICYRCRRPKAKATRR